jgi:hypothetical protein
MPQAHPIRLWAANGVSTIRLSFSSTRDHRVLVTIRKDGLAAELEEATKRFFLPRSARFAKTRANQP